MSNEKPKDLSLYGWLFTYNAYISKWVAYNSNTTNYFSGEGPSYQDDDINKLIETIRNLTTNGKPDSNS